MKRDLELQLIERLLAHIESDSRDRSPAMVSRPVSDYLDPARFDEERAALFGDHPVVVGHTSQLGQPGSFFTHEASGVPIVVTRAEDDRLRAFVNVCRHRGGSLADTPCGTGRRLTCGYHGWSFDLEGQLRGIPMSDGFDQLDRSQFGLMELPLVERHGLVFVWPRPQTGHRDGHRDALDGVLCGVSDDLADQQPESEFLSFRSWEVGCNWKVLLDNFLELYHLPTLHSSNIGPMFEPNRILFDQFGPSGRRIDGRKSIRSLVDTPKETWRLRDHALITYYLFPNTQTFWTQDYFSWLSVWPVSVERTICTQSIVANWAADTDERRAHLQTNLDLFALTLDEDFASSETVQRGLATGANTVFTFGRHEQEASGVHAAIDEALARSRAICSPAVAT